MPDAVKAEALNGSWCYYGFYFPDAVVKAIEKTRGIECPPHANPRGWMQARKAKILNETSSELHMRFSTRLARRDSENDLDIVFFA